MTFSLLASITHRLFHILLGTYDIITANNLLDYSSRSMA
jgi:hypothetical protein